MEISNNRRILLSAGWHCKSLIEELFNEVWTIGSAAQFDAPQIVGGQKVLIVWGGEDISPSIYNQIPSKYTSATKFPSKRDQFEISLCKEAISKNIPIIGICRGAQLMCALSGGTLIQHVDNHVCIHPIETNRGEILETTSLHHQMMNPFKIQHELLAWSSPNLSDVYIGEKNGLVENAYEAGFKEPEIAWFPQTKSLCIQGHPEFDTEDTPFIKYVQELIEQFCFNKSQ